MYKYYYDYYLEKVTEDVEPSDDDYIYVEINRVKTYIYEI